MTSRILMKTLIATVTAVLTSCGGGGGDGGEPLKVAFFGDSTCAASVETAQRHLQGEAILRHECVPGSAAWHLQTGQDALHSVPYSETLKGVREGVVSFRYGPNDTQLYSAENFRAIMEDLVTRTEAAGKRVMLETPSPVHSRPELAEMGARVEVLRGIAKAHPRVLLCDHFQRAFEVGLERDATDGVHPSAAGIAFQGQTLAACVRRLAAS